MPEITDFWLDRETDTSCPVGFQPEFSFVMREQAIRASHRTIGGIQRVYDWATWKAFTVPIRFVSSEDTFRINQWWRDSETLEFTMNTSENLKTVECRLTNDAQPISGMISPYSDLHEGVLMIEATDASSFKEMFFVLDDAHRGLLDKNYNSIR